jgi:hypothetical protein
METEAGWGQGSRERARAEGKEGGSEAPRPSEAVRCGELRRVGGRVVQAGGLLGSHGGAGVDASWLGRVAEDLHVGPAHARTGLAAAHEDVRQPEV